MKHFLLILFCIITTSAIAQEFTISGVIQLEKAPVEGATVILQPLNIKTGSLTNGSFQFTRIKSGTYQVVVTYVGAKPYQQELTIADKDLSVSINLTLDTKLLNEVIIKDATEQVSGNLRQVEGTAIYAGKKTEVINLANINANLATNNARQVYSRIPGLNIWEYDGGGIQLGIGGRGLNPSRVSNFNTRQNGYDISADALGYPESYYTPPTEAVEKIEIIRGAASLQYGTQFGGLINFQLKKGPEDKPLQFLSRQTGGSFGFFNSFNSLGGRVKKLNYYTYYQYKRGDSWRPNSHFDQHSAYAHLDYDFNEKLTLTGEYTFMHYLAQQPGGLTDADFQSDPSQSVRARNWFTVDWNLLSVSLDYRFSDQTRLNWRTYTLQAGREALGILNYINRPDPGGPRDLLADKYKNYGSEIRLLHQYPLFKGQRSTLLTGVRLYKGLTLRKQGEADEGTGPQFNFVPQEPNQSDYRFPGTNIAGFVENIFQLNDKWNITPGLRMEYISTKADGYYYQVMRFVPNVKINEEREKNRAFILAGIGSSYQLTKGMELYANISQNYRSINFNDLRVQNENARVDSLLKDETGYTADGGIRGKLNDWLYYDVSIFYFKYNDRIGSVFTKNETIWYTACEPM
jgi:Fe(3+) dicitrate transport protein